MIYQEGLFQGRTFYREDHLSDVKYLLAINLVGKGLVTSVNPNTMTSP